MNLILFHSQDVLPNESGDVITHNYLKLNVQDTVNVWTQLKTDRLNFNTNLREQLFNSFASKLQQVKKSEFLEVGQNKVEFKDLPNSQDYFAILYSESDFGIQYLKQVIIDDSVSQPRGREIIKTFQASVALNTAICQIP